MIDILPLLMLMAMVLMMTRVEWPRRYHHTISRIIITTMIHENDRIMMSMVEKIVTTYARSLMVKFDRAAAIACNRASIPSHNDRMACSLIPSLPIVAAAVAISLSSVEDGSEGARLVSLSSDITDEAAAAAFRRRFSLSTLA
jgi:hypothetical protein